MKFLKKNFKFIIILLVTIIVTSGISVYATTYLASNIGYTKAGKNVNNVGEALDDLYNTQSGISQTNATASDILSGKKAYTTGGLITGTYSASTYSTTEQEVGTWIDGTTKVYRRVLTGTTSSTVGDTVVLTNFNISKLLAAYGYVEGASGSQHWQCPCGDGGYNNGCGFYYEIDNQTIYLRIYNGNYTSKEYVGIIEYIK